MTKVFKNFMNTAGFISVVLTAVLLSAPYAAAQEENSRNSEYQLGTMTVTAQKQEENVQEVPVSMSVLNSIDLEDKNISNIWNLMDSIPGLMNFDTGMSDIFSQPSMRGITAPSSTFNTSVGLYVDGAPILASPGFSATLIDIERVEVLRGPQGTLYGKNTEAGAINIITRKPGNDVRGKVGFQYGEDNKKMLTGSVSGPVLKDKLFFSIAGQYDAKDGFVDNKYLGGHDDDNERYYGRGQVRWTPTSDWDVTLSMSRIATDEGGSPQVANAAMMAMYGQPALPDRATYSDYRPRRDTYNDIQTLKVDYQINSSVSISSITARKMTDWYAKVDYDFSPVHIYHVYNDSQYSNISQEFRVNWDTKKLKGVMGVYADSHMNDIDIGNLMPDSSKVSTTKRELGGDSYAVYGQADYELTKALHLIAGLRYEKQNMDYDDDMLGVDTDESWSKVTPKLTLQYHFSPSINVYATAAEGYRTGGFNHTATDLEYRTFDPEKLWSYEIGMKTSLLDNRLLINMSLYYMDIQDMQVEESIDPLTTYVTNAAEATSKGGEIEITAQPMKGLTLTAGFSYNETEFDSFSDSAGDYSGNKNPFAPEYTVNLGAVYRHSSGIFVSAGLAGYGEIYLEKQNQNKRDAFELINAKVGYEMEHFDIYLYAENLFDEEYDSLNYYGYYHNYSPPREVGLQLAYRF